MDLYPHPKQSEVIRLLFKQAVKAIDLMCGRRSGKTKLFGIIASIALSMGWKVLYVGPTADQINPFLNYVKLHLSHLPLKHIRPQGVHIITLPGSSSFGELRARTGAKPDNLRGFDADLILVDEMQNQPSNLYEDVLSPMTLDSGGAILTCMTPPDLLATKNVANMRAAKEFHKKYIKSGLHHSFTWTTWDNPHIPRENIQKMKDTLDPVVYDREIMGKLLDQAPGALWDRESIKRIPCPTTSQLQDIVIAVDPAYSVHSDETGIMVIGLTTDNNGVVLHDASGHYMPDKWGSVLMELCNLYGTYTIPVESNFMGNLIHSNIQSAAEASNMPILNIVPINAKESKVQRAFPVSTLYKSNRVFHIEEGDFEILEDQLCLWEPHQFARASAGANASPDRIDALVHGIRYLMVDSGLNILTADELDAVPA